MARPPKQDRSTVRTKQTLILSTHAQRKRWEAMARKQGYTLSQWVRLVLDRAARTG